MHFPFDLWDGAELETVAGQKIQLGALEAQRRAQRSAWAAGSLGGSLEVEVNAVQCQEPADMY